MKAPKANILLLFVSVILLFTSCVVGPDYKEPDIYSNDDFANQRFTTFSENDIELFWWKGFKDEKLNSLIDRALDGNLDVKIATARVLEARALRSEVKFDLFPIITSEASYTRSRISEETSTGSFISDPESDLFDAGFDASWELDIFGRVRRTLEQGKAVIEANIASRRDIIVVLLAEVARNYFELRGTQNQLEVAKRNAENQQETLDLTTALLEGGRGTELDTSRASAQLNATLSTIPPLESRITQIQNRLSVLIGEQPGSLYEELSVEKPLPALPKLVYVGKPEDLIRRRQDIVFAERNLAAATATIGIATADLFPRITIFGGIGFSADSLSNFGTGGSTRYSIGPSIFWEAFNLGQVKARIAATDAASQAALAEYELSVLTALEEIENSLVDYGKNLEQLAYLRKAAESSRKAVELSRLRYQFGVSDFLTVLDSESRLLEDEDNLAEGETNTAISLVIVYKALGGGWEIEYEKAVYEIPEGPSFSDKAQKVYENEK